MPRDPEVKVEVVPDRISRLKVGVAVEAIDWTVLSVYGPEPEKAREEPSVISPQVWPVEAEPLPRRTEAAVTVTIDWQRLLR
jgi:hypothetical protein